MNLLPDFNPKTLPVERAQEIPGALRVRISREPWSPVFIFTLDSGYTEELECGDEARDWFKVRGANMDVVERALDYAWNFYRSEVYISKPKVPGLDSRVKPQLNV